VRLPIPPLRQRICIVLNRFLICQIGEKEVSLNGMPEHLSLGYAISLLLFVVSENFLKVRWFFALTPNNLLSLSKKEVSRMILSALGVGFHGG
jgi:hypothetical protein